MYHMLQNENYNTDLIEPCNDECSFCFLNYTDVLGKNSLFRGLSKGEIGEIIRSVHHQSKAYSKGEVVANEGDNYDRLILIVKGAVVGEMMDFEGKVLRVEQRSAPETVAIAFIFGNNNRLPVTITAVEETRLLFIPRDDLVKLFSGNKIVLSNFLDNMADRAQFLSRHLRMLGLHSIRGKIAHYLLEQVKLQGSTDIRMPHTQAALSEMFGVARPSVARVLRDMNNASIIESRGKNIRIINTEELSTMLS